LRLFVAIELDEAVRSQLLKVRRSLEACCANVKWVRPELLHVTVKFLGEVPDPRVVEVSEAVSRAAAMTKESFEFPLSTCGCFPPRGAVRVIWAGDSAANEPLAACVNAVETELGKIGQPRETRPFSAHVTLGRVNEDRSRGAIRTAVEGCTMARASQEVSSLVLMSSALSRGGPTYSVVSRARFGEGSPIGSKGT
jgi:2'-5' RNA ligase